MRFIGLLYSIIIVIFLCLGYSLYTSYEENKKLKASFDPTTLLTKELIERYQLIVVDYDDVKKAVGTGTRENAKAILIDACPNSKYVEGTIPSSINIPDTEIEAFISQLNNVPKDKELIVFCGGWTCSKSITVAEYLREKGYINVKLYPSGEPEWSAKNYVEVSLPFVQNIVKDNAALLIDARPYELYMTGTIPGALSIPDTEVETLKGRLPNDKATEIVVFCAGYSCVKSHNLAKKLQYLGYKNIKVFSGGYPEWITKGLQTTEKEFKKVEISSTQKDIYIDGLKLGADIGTVDSEWFKTVILNDNVPNNVVLVDVRSSDEYMQGHINGAINIDIEKFDAHNLFKKLPKDKLVVFTCQSGTRSLEAFYKLRKAGMDISKVFYFNASFTCNQQNQCAIKINKPLGIK